VRDGGFDSCSVTWRPVDPGSVTWGPDEHPGGGLPELLYTSEEQTTHQRCPFRSVYRGWIVPTKKCGYFEMNISLPLPSRGRVYDKSESHHHFPLQTPRRSPTAPLMQLQATRHDGRVFPPSLLSTPNPCNPTKPRMPPMLIEFGIKACPPPLPKKGAPPLSPQSAFHVCLLAGATSEVIQTRSPGDATPSQPLLSHTQALRAAPKAAAVQPQDLQQPGNQLLDGPPPPFVRTPWRCLQITALGPRFP